MTAQPDETRRTEETTALFEAVVALEDPEQAQRFLRDLCTRRELEEMTSRWAVVRLLATGMSYREIHDTSGVSTATVTRINEWLRHGTGGYREMLVRLGFVDGEAP